MGARQASALDAEAATWHLLWHLYGVTDRAFPAGLGGPALDGVGGLCTAAQRIADAVAQYDDLNRCVKRRSRLHAGLGSPGCSMQ